MRNLILTLLGLPHLRIGKQYSYTPMKPEQLQTWGKRQPQYIRVFGRRRSAIKNWRAAFEQWIRFADAFGLPVTGLLSKPIWYAVMGLIAGLIAGAIFGGAFSGNQHLESAQVAAKAGPFVILLFGLGGAGMAALTAVPLVLRQLHRVSYADAYPTSFLDPTRPGAMTELGRIRLYRGAFCNDPAMFFGGSETSGVVRGYIRMKAPEGVSVAHTSISDLLNRYLPISPEDWIAAVEGDSEDDKAFHELVGDAVEGYHGAAASDARAFKKRLIKAGNLELQTSRPKWKRYNEFIFWVFCGLAVVACVLQSITGYSLSLDPDSIKGLIP